LTWHTYGLYSPTVAAYLLQVRDVTGVEIRLTRECWGEHILVHHPVMRHYFEQVPPTITSPDVVHRSSTPSETRFYYRRLPRRQLWVLVIADIKPSGHLGYVKTAMVVDSIRPSEVLWQKP
jgi:hypothetical protein